MNPPILLLGDCLNGLRLMPESSVDSIVTDPPYGLSFMGKKWDYDVPSVEIWAECLRVLKPGGHLLAFAGTRTQHRMAVRIEDAGFEIRDMIAWVYGSGFPKSMDVSKAIDKARSEDVGPTRVICRVIRSAMDAQGLKSKDLTPHFDGCHARLIDHWAARDTDSQPSLPTLGQWQKLREVLGIGPEHDAEFLRLSERKGQHGDAWQAAEVIGRHVKVSPGNSFRVGLDGAGLDDIQAIKAANSAAAAQWQGWGTALKPALKPALEPITVARKPLIGTVAANVLEHGTGGLNIDACRVPGGSTRRTNTDDMGYHGGDLSTGYQTGSDAGRWPANLIHDGSDEVRAVFPSAKGQLAIASSEGTARAGQNTYGAMARRSTGLTPRVDLDSNAARFFYCAKTSKADRNGGMNDAPSASAGEMTGGRAEGSSGLNSPRAGAGRTAGGQNHHPTVKPTELMGYLCRLVTPPGGTVLDPFMGSGSTGKAALREGFHFIGFEQNPEYYEIAKQRVRGKNT